MHFIQWLQRSRLHKKSSFGLKPFLHITSPAYFRCNLSLPILVLSITAIYLLLKLTFVTSMAAQKARHQQHFSAFIWNFPAPVNFALLLTVTAAPNCHPPGGSISYIILWPLKSDYKSLLFFVVVVFVNSVSKKSYFKRIHTRTYNVDLQTNFRFWP